MKRTAALIVLLLLAVLAVGQQTIPRNRAESNGMPPGWTARNVEIPTQRPSPKPTPAPLGPVTQPNNGQKQRLAALFRQMQQREQAAIDAREQYTTELQKTLGELGLPADTTVKWNGDDPTFGRIDRKPENRRINQE